eukprot:TRINITY_DN5501_c0_g1_i6.p2 TRINITY_DN5501_c0_g1~~TRINITY_DN5501_c0_g1_i6.p2  ORF type:complete len:221 (-),score=-3.07 TRINITY_DN5501_c0_g1_i6:627-1289(-)
MAFKPARERAFSAAASEVVAASSFLLATEISAVPAAFAAAREVLADSRFVTTEDTSIPYVVQVVMRESRDAISVSVQSPFRKNHPDYRPSVWEKSRQNTRSLLPIPMYSALVSTQSTWGSATASGYSTYSSPTQKVYNPDDFSGMVTIRKRISHLLIPASRPIQRMESMCLPQLRIWNLPKPLLQQQKQQALQIFRLPIKNWKQRPLHWLQLKKLSLSLV